MPELACYPPIPRLIIAGTASHVGKTTIAAGLIAALRQRGMRVQPFKAGPDYIDPTYHALAANRPARNLNSWLLTLTQVRGVFDRAVRDADIAIVEGGKGLFDGAGYDTEIGSTAELAKLLGAPVILVVDVAATARSVAATVRGFQLFDPAVHLAGVIVNRAGSESHAAGVTAAIEAETGLPVLGGLLRSTEIALTERYLGLLPEAEHGPAGDLILRLGALIERRCDVDRLIALAATAPLVGWTSGNRPHVLASLELEACAATVELDAKHAVRDGAPVVAVGRDEAFSFYYEDNLDLLRAAGAHLSFFSPMRDASLPSGTAGLYVGGGFPELYATESAANVGLRQAIREAVRAGVPCYAECGGLMYLTEALIDASGQRHVMVGLLPGEATMAERRLSLGYTTVEARRDTLMLRAGEAIRGHEFHYSMWDHAPDTVTAAYCITARRDGRSRLEGYALGPLLASYVHLHFAAMPVLAERFVYAAADFASGDAPRLRPMDDAQQEK